MRTETVTMTSAGSSVILYYDVGETTNWKVRDKAGNSGVVTNNAAFYTGKANMVPPTPSLVAMRNIPAPAPKKTTSVSIGESLLIEAKSLGINVSKAAEEGLGRAVAAAKARAWVEENRAAIEAYNRRVEEHGMLLDELRLF